MAYKRRGRAGRRSFRRGFKKRYSFKKRGRRAMPRGKYKAIGFRM